MLRNEDFRAILMTPRPPAPAKAQPRRGGSSRHTTAESAASSSSSAYKDRAAERRRQQEDIDAAEERKALARGLDFSLLAQTRRELARNEEATSSASSVDRPPAAASDQQQRKGRSKVAQGVQALLERWAAGRGDPAATAVANRFRRGRVVYVFGADEEEDRLPSVVVTSRDAESFEADPSQKAAERIIFAKIASICAKRDAEAAAAAAFASKEEQPQPTEQAAVTDKSVVGVATAAGDDEEDEDEDIFAGLGSYDAASAAKQASAQQQQQQAPYFSSEPAESAPKQPTQEELSELLAEARLEAHKHDLEAERREGAAEEGSRARGPGDIDPAMRRAFQPAVVADAPSMAAEARKKQDAEDEYAECYPDAYELSSFWDFRSTDLEQPGKKKKKGGDCKDEDEKREEKKAKKVPDEKRRSQKLNQELVRIREILDKKQRPAASPGRSESDESPSPKRHRH